MVSVLTFCISYIFIVEKINLNLNQTHSFVKQVETLRAENHASLGFFKEDKDNFPIKYIVNMLKDENPIFISEVNEIPKTPIFLITSKEHFDAFGKDQKSFQMMTSGKIGRDDVIVFVRKK